MSYPISEVGVIHRTDKSLLMKYLEAKVPTTDSLLRNNVVIYDGFVLLHESRNLPFSYGEILEKILNYIV